MTSQQPPENADLAAQVEANMNQLRHGRDVERTIFFSDAVFAIAMTLLVLELRLPETHYDSASAFNAAVLEQSQGFFAYLLSFFLIGITWITHHRRFRAIQGYDGRLQLLNLVTLCAVAFMPIPTGMLFEYHIASAVPPILYAVTMAVVYLSLNAVWWHAHRVGLLDPSLGEPFYRLALHSIDALWIVFLVSVPLALVAPGIAPYSWVAIWPLSLILARVNKHRFVRDETARLRAQQDAA